MENRKCSLGGKTLQELLTLDVISQEKAGGQHLALNTIRCYDGHSPPTFGILPRLRMNDMAPLGCVIA